MQALDLAIRNFAVAEHLLQLEQLFADAAQHQPSPDYVVKLCAEMAVPPGAALHHLKNSHTLVGIDGSVAVPSCRSATRGLDFLLRQAVVVSCGALESFIWDILRENALTVIKARGRRADATLRNITLTLDDYLSLEDYDDPDDRLRQIILNRFERGSLYDLAKVDEIMQILTVRNFWNQMAAKTGIADREIKSHLTELIQRRNKIAHRADRPDEGTPADQCDPHGLRPISRAWASSRVATAKAFAQGAAEVVSDAIQGLEQIIAQQEEQRLARQTIAPGEPDLFSFAETATDQPATAAASSTEPSTTIP
jgi:hypothetical protein